MTAEGRHGSERVKIIVLPKWHLRIYCRELSERPYMKEHSDTIVPHSFVDKNSGSNLVQNKTLKFWLIFIIFDSLKVELSELDNNMAKSYASSIWVA